MDGFGESTRIHSVRERRTIRCFAAVVAAVLSGWAGLARSQEVQWQRVTDPNERAFTVEVPVGWHAEVGVVRRNGLIRAPSSRCVRRTARSRFSMGITGFRFHCPQ